LAVNISDIAAMGGLPKHAVISAGLPGDLPASFVDDLYKGIQAVAREFDVNIVGGDTNASDALVISVALLGECEKSKAVYRSTAKAGDVIFVTGELGGSYASRRHLQFMPRVRQARYLVQNFKIHAMMDISDGLAGDIHRLTQESRVGALICRDAIPVSGAASSLEAALSDGEDFELLFALSPREAAKLSLSKNEFGMNFFRPVGRIVEKKYGVCLVDAQGTAWPMKVKGFDHFA
jgi:thiamine-monophosphate kinase